MPVVPSTTSPGKLFLRYTSATVPHIVACQLINGVDIETLSPLRTEATAFANVIKALLDTTASITAWGIMLPGGAVGYEEAFGSAIAGTRSPGAQEYRSLTLTISGDGTPVGVGGARGKTRVQVFVGAAWSPAAGVKTSALTIDAALTALASYLHSNLTMFADKYGQHAEPKAYITWQFNAHTQQKWGF